MRVPCVCPLRLPKALSILLPHLATPGPARSLDCLHLKSTHSLSSGTPTPLPFLHSSCLPVCCLLHHSSLYAASSALKNRPRARKNTEATKAQEGRDKFPLGIMVRREAEISRALMIFVSEKQRQREGCGSVLRQQAMLFSPVCRLDSHWAPFSEQELQPVTGRLQARGLEPVTTSFTSFHFCLVSSCGC